MQPQSLLRLGDLESASVKELERLLDLNEKKQQRKCFEWRTRRIEKIKHFLSIRKKEGLSHDAM